MTEDDREQVTTDGSRALLPTKTTLYKVLKVLSGGTAARVRNLTNGDESTRPISKLGRLHLSHLYDLHLDPTIAFTEDDTLRKADVYRQLQGQFDFLEHDKVPIPPAQGRLRTGRTYTANVSTNKKSCLKQVTPSTLFESDLDLMSPNLRQATMRGTWLANELGYALSPLHTTLITKKFKHLSNSLHLYNVPNHMKNKTCTKVRFTDPEISTKKATPSLSTTVTALEIFLMAAYYSVSYQEMGLHIATRSHDIQESHQN